MSSESVRAPAMRSKLPTRLPETSLPTCMCTLWNLTPCSSSERSNASAATSPYRPPVMASLPTVIRPPNPRPTAMTTASAENTSPKAVSTSTRPAKGAAQQGDPPRAPPCAPAAAVSGEVAIDASGAASDFLFRGLTSEAVNSGGRPPSLPVTAFPSTAGLMSTTRPCRKTIPAMFSRAFLVSRLTARRSTSSNGLPSFKTLAEPSHAQRRGDGRPLITLANSAHPPRAGINPGP